MKPATSPWLGKFAQGCHGKGHRSTSSYHIGSTGIVKLELFVLKEGIGVEYAVAYMNRILGNAGVASSLFNRYMTPPLFFGVSYRQYYGSSRPYFIIIIFKFRRRMMMGNVWGTRMHMTQRWGAEGTS